MYRKDVLGHVFTGGTVTAGSSPDQLSITVGKCHTEAVDLELAGVGDRMAFSRA